MQLNIKTKNVRVQPNEEAMIRKKVERLTRYLDQLSNAEVILSTEKNSRGPERRVAQLTVRANGSLLRAEEEDAELLAAFDAALSKIERRITRFKGRYERRRKGGRASDDGAAAQANGAAEEDD